MDISTSSPVVEVLELNSSASVVAEPVHEIQEVHEDDEIDDDAVAVNLGPNRSHFKPFDVIGKASNYWKHFRDYPKTAKAETLAVCKLCYTKYIEEPGVHSSKWEVTVGKSKSNSKLRQHLGRYYVIHLIIIF